MGGVNPFETSAKRGGRPGKINAPLSKKLSDVKWGEFTFSSVFNRIEQGRRLKKDDQLPGHIPFVMAGTTNRGVVNYISNPIAVFPKNSITVDIFGNAFYRNYVFGAGDDTGVYWNDSEVYSPETMLFFTMSMGKAMHGMFSFGKKLRSSQSLNLTMQLPILENGAIDFAFMESFIAELEAERVAELEAYLTATGLQDYTLTEEEQKALEEYENINFQQFSIPDIFNITNTRNILSQDIVANSGTTPYLCASAENNAVNCYISYNEDMIEHGNCIFIGGKTFVVTYQEKDFFSNDSHNLILSLKDDSLRNKLVQLYMVTCIKQSLGHKYSWGNSISKQKIQSDTVALPTIEGRLNEEVMKTFISAIQKLVIQDVVRYTKQKVEATKTITTH